MNYLSKKKTETPDIPLAPGLVKHEGELTQEQVVPYQHHRSPRSLICNPDFSKGIRSIKPIRLFSENIIKNKVPTKKEGNGISLKDITSQPFLIFVYQQNAPGILKIIFHHK